MATLDSYLFYRFGMEARFWMNLQSHHDLEVAKDAIAGKLDREVEVLKAA